MQLQQNRTLDPLPESLRMSVDASASSAAPSAAPSSAAPGASPAEAGAEKKDDDAKPEVKPEAKSRQQSQTIRRIQKSTQNRLTKPTRQNRFWLISRRSGGVFIEEINGEHGAYQNHRRFDRLLRHLAGNGSSGIAAHDAGNRHDYHAVPVDLRVH